jgi:Na+/pantothenate symporter
MILTQHKVTLCFSVVMTLCYWGCAVLRKRKLDYDNLLMFGLLSAGVVTGVYIVIGAYRSSDSNSLYSGVFGAVLTLVSIGKIKDKFESAWRKKPTADAAEAQ